LSIFHAFLSQRVPISGSLKNNLLRKIVVLHRQKSGKLKPEDVSKPIKKTLKRGANVFEVN
jgi:hypothetical protein